MARRSQLSDRLLAVLDDTRRRATVTPGKALLGMAFAALVVVPVAGAARGGESQGGQRLVGATPAAYLAPTAVPEPVRTRLPSLDIGALALQPVLAMRTETLCDWNSDAKNTSTSSNIDDDEMRIRIKRDNCRLDIDSRGEIEFNEVETDILILSPGGYVEIEERAGQSSRRLEIRGTRDGGLSRRWFVDGDERPYDGDAKEWLAGILPVVYRVTGIDAQERAARILAAQGVDGLLQEISYIRSDHVARRYYEVLITEGDLSAADLRRVVRQAGSEIGSDFELSQLLTGLAESEMIDDAVVLAYVEAAGTISSDFEQRRALNAILNRPTLSREAADAMLGLATDISSDFELAELLIDIVNKHPIERSMTPSYFKAAGTISSDFEHRRVLNAVLAQGAPDIDVLDRALEASAKISSDFELAELLRQVSELYPLDRSIPGSYRAAARTIGSDSEMARVLQAVFRRGNLSPSALDEALRASSTIDSDFEMAGLLLDVAAQYDLNTGGQAAFFEALRSVNSDFEHARVLKGVLQEQSLTESLVTRLLTSATGINSDFELAGVLVSTARQFPIDDRLRPSFMRAADSIGSTHERDRVLAALRGVRR